MDLESFSSGGFDIFEIYHRYCDFMSAAYAYGNGDCLLDKESQNGKFSRESLNQLLKMVESRSWTRISVFEEIYKLMMRLNVMVNTSEFSRFYDFVFLICRENGQKNISVGRAVMAWRLVLAGRFPLLNEWCDYVEKNQRHNISEDTWRQLLAFSRCVKANLEGYDPEGAWPVLIDDFVEHLYRCRSYTDKFNSCWKCGDSDGQQLEVSPPGADSPYMPGLKRKFYELEEQNRPLDDMDSYNSVTSNKRHTCREDYPCDLDDSMEVVKQSGPWGCSLSPCHVEGCLSKGFAGLFSNRSRTRC